MKSLSIESQGQSARGWASLIVLILGAHFALHLWLYANFDNDYDAGHYARIAHEIQSREFAIAPHTFSNRFGVTVPTALSYRLFGVNRFSTTLWPLVSSVLTILLVFFTVRRFFGMRAASLSAFLLALNIIQIKYASRLLPDIIVSMFMMAAVALLALARTTASPRKQRIYGVICALSLFAGLLTKGTVAWALPFFLGVTVCDVFRRRNSPFWFGLACSGTAAVTFLLAAYFVSTGNALYRLEGIEGTHNVRDWSYLGKSWEAYARRLSYEPIRFIIARPGLGLLLALSAPALVHCIRPLAFLPAGARLWAGYCLALLASFWFGTTSLTYYNPLYLVERFLIPLLAPLSILSGITLAALLSGEDRTANRRGILLIGAALLASIGVLWDGGIRRQALYGVFLLWTLALAFSPAVPFALVRQRGAAIKTALVVLLYAGTAAYYANKGLAAEQPPLIKLEREVVEEHLLQTDQATVVFTDRHSAFALPLYFKAGALERIRFVDWSDFEHTEGMHDAKKLVYINQPLLIATKLNWGHERPHFALEQPPHWKRLEARSTDGERWILLFEIDSTEDLKLGG